MAEEAQRRMGTAAEVTEEDMHIFFSCGKGHDAETPKGRAAMNQMAATEGIFLDPIYTGMKMEFFRTARPLSLYTLADLLLYWAASCAHSSFQGKR